ncbi:MAG: hypothetical protein R3C11_02965 [Planctomycetaceae bacterium]
MSAQLTKLAEGKSLRRLTGNIAPASDIVGHGVHLILPEVTARDCLTVVSDPTDNMLELHLLTECC